MELNRPSRYDIACHFCVSRIAGATVPYTRLSNILECMFHGRPLTALSLSYLQQQNLNELHLLATGQITYEAFIAAFDPALVARERAARVEHLTREAERLSQQAERVMQRNARAKQQNLSVLLARRSTIVIAKMLRQLASPAKPSGRHSARIIVRLLKPCATHA